MIWSDSNIIITKYYRRQISFLLMNCSGICLKYAYAQSLQVKRL